MKNKIIILLFFLFFIVGCSSESSENKLQISTIKLKENYIVGKIKNLTKNAYDAIIEFELKSNTLVEKHFCYETLKPEETIDLECFIYDIDDTYTIKVKDIQLTKKEIPILKTGKIDTETLKYHFDNIYKKHNLNFITFVNDIKDNKYPFIDEIIYTETTEELHIKSYFEYKNNHVYFFEIYKTSFDELNNIWFNIIPSDNDGFANNDVSINELLTKVSLMPSISNTSKESIQINKTLLRKDIEQNYCIKVYDWCISTDYNDDMYSFVIDKK